MTGCNLAKNFKSPDPSKFNYDAYMKYIIEKLPPESPILFYLHPNAEISYLTSQGQYVFNSILDIQGGSSSGTEEKEEDKKKQGGGNKPKVDPMMESIKRYADRLKEKKQKELELKRLAEIEEEKKKLKEQWKQTKDILPKFESSAMQLIRQEEKKNKEKKELCSWFSNKSISLDRRRLQ